MIRRPCERWLGRRENKTQVAKKIAANFIFYFCRFLLFFFCLCLYSTYIHKADPTYKRPKENSLKCGPLFENIS